MNFLAKHFFDYQSFINLPHTAVQMHKTPPSQAGTDPSAAWAPKDLHLAGKNQAAPAARANRNYHGDQRTGSHRHGRPSKLEFRSWGERHGELREEKIVPHKDHWMEVLEGGRRVSLEMMGGAGATAADHFPSEYFPRALQQRQHPTKQQQQQRRQHSLETPLPPSMPSSQFAGGGPPIRILVILTLSGHLDFITVTVKSIKGLPPMAKDPLIKLRLFDGPRVLEERGPLKASTKRQQQSSSPTAVGQERQCGQSFMLKAPNPLRLPFCHMAISLHSPSGLSRGQSTNLLGNCVLGPSGNISPGNSHWRQMIKKMVFGVPIAMWHELTGEGPQTKIQQQQQKLDKSPPRKNVLEKEKKTRISAKAEEKPSDVDINLGNGESKERDEK